MKLSVVIITYNEERNIKRCLTSVKDIADEIVVVDSASTDNTTTIALSYNARVIQRPFTGYSDQKNFATSQASNDWILSLDADEEVTDTLRQSIIKVKDNIENNVYDMPRLTNYCGKWIKHCGWYPDLQRRLYNRTKGRWVSKQVHEYWQPDDANEKAGRLSGDLLHYSFSSVSEHLKKIEKYSELAAKDAVEHYKKVSLLKIWVSPKWHFISEYIFKLGFLDGYYGYTICRLSAYAAFVKYTKIRMYSKLNNEK